MDDDAEKYIQSEIDLSRLRVMFLAKSNSLSDSARNRLIEIELTFQSIDFSKLKIKTISDAKSAVSTFRASRSEFSSIYIHNKEDMVDRFIKFLDGKINLNHISGDIKEVKSKMRIIAIASALKNILNYAKTKLNGIVELSDLIISLLTDNRNEIFSLYNKEVSELTQEYFLRFNKKVKINLLQNIIEESSSGDFFIKKINFYGKNAIGIIFPSDIQNRETMWLVHKKISVYGIDVSELFSNNIRTIVDEDINKSALILKDVSELGENNRLLSKYHYLMSQVFRTSLSKRDVLTQKIDLENSVLLTPSSRTEDENIKKSYEEFFDMAKKIINDIK
jgi:hypothetical protein